MKRPFDEITENFSDNLERIRENQKENFYNFEKLMIWVVGFSIAGLSIIVSNITSFSTKYNHFITKLILTLFSMSIIFGIFYRVAFLLFQIQYQKIEFYLKGAFSNKKIMNYNFNDIENETEIKEVIRLLKFNFDLDYLYVLKTYDDLSSENKKIVLNNLKNNYNKYGNSIKQEYEFTIDYVKDVFGKAFGFSKKRIDKIFNSNTSKRIKIYGAILTISFIISVLSFISILIILTSIY